MRAAAEVVSLCSGRPTLQAADAAPRPDVRQRNRQAASRSRQKRSREMDELVVREELLAEQNWYLTGYARELHAEASAL